MKNRVLFVIKTVEYGGMEKHLTDLVLRLDLSHVDPVILYFGTDFYSQVLNQQHKLCVTIYHGLKSNGFLAYWVPFIRFNPQIIVFVNGHLGIFPWYAYVAARFSPATRVFAIEHLIADRAPPRIEARGLVDRLYKKVGWRSRYMFRMGLAGIISDRTICVSNAVRDRLVKDYGYPKHKTLTVWNGVNLKEYGYHGKKSDFVRKTLAIGCHEVVLISVSRLIRHKAIDTLLHAMSTVSKEHPSCKCIIVGGGPWEGELRAKAIELGLTSSVMFVGNSEDVRPYLEAGDIFVLPSKKEGLPLALLEAMAYGLPCVVTNVGGNSEAVLHGHNGLVVTPGSAEELATAVKYLLVHEEERRRMAMNARKRVQEFFNVDEAMAKLEAVLFR